MSQSATPSNTLSNTSTLKQVFICGSALRGQPDHQNLQSAKFLGEAKTAPKYRLHAIKDGWHPGIFEVSEDETEKEGISIPGEIYELTAEQYDYLVSTEPPDMYPAEVTLADGGIAIAMLYPKPLIDAGGWPDISEIGGWAAYKAQQD
ncbi:MAG: AIG2-like family [Phormidesmis priestleyi Ana]|uniref:AIG2-like family n=1 Tax=Phormidesmis priestleyi Ana TaxID=1666911 RepID=A0A0P7ZKG5_9CYAN|nr:MAG: AIG2-like family [Phormidesmis priestleyi Ana]